MAESDDAPEAAARVPGTSDQVTRDVGVGVTGQLRDGYWTILGPSNWARSLGNCILLAANPDCAVVDGADGVPRTAQTADSTRKLC